MRWSWSKNWPIWTPPPASFPEPRGAGGTESRGPGELRRGCLSPGPGLAPWVVFYSRYFSDNRKRVDDRKSTMSTSPKCDRFGAKNTSFREEAPLILEDIPLASEPLEVCAMSSLSCIMLHIQFYFCTFLPFFSFF